MNKNISMELKRNIFHLSLGLTLAYIILFLGSAYSIVIFGTCIVLGLVVSGIIRRNIHVPVFSFFITIMERKTVRPGIGVIHFFAGGFIALILFETEIAFISMLVLALADSVSTIVGIAVGKIRVYKGRTLEGSLAGFIAAFAVCTFYLPISLAFMVCFTGSLVELLSPIDDNILIPPVVGIVLFMLMV